MLCRVYHNQFTDMNFVEQLKDMIASRRTARRDGAPGPQSTPRLEHASLMLRQVVEGDRPKLVGPGPHCIHFHLARTDQEKKKIVELYASQFAQPSPKEMLRIVSMQPPIVSSRRKKKAKGTYSWYIYSESTSEIACAVTVVINSYDGGRSMLAEMPMFATGVGYKRVGLARLLNAAMLDFCRTVEGMELVLVSAMESAVPFWLHVGYRPLEKKERGPFEFYFNHHCHNFNEAKHLVYRFNEHPGETQRLLAQLRRMPTIELAEPHALVAE